MDFISPSVPQSPIYSSIFIYYSLWKGQQIQEENLYTARWSLNWVPRKLASGIVECLDSKNRWLWIWELLLLQGLNHRKIAIFLKKEVKLTPIFFEWFSLGYWLQYLQIFIVLFKADSTKTIKWNLLNKDQRTIRKNLP